MCTLTNLFLVAILTTITIGQKVNESCVIGNNNNGGTCRLPNDCPEANVLTSQGIKVKLCGTYLNVLPIFCCSNTGGTLPTPTPSPAPLPSPSPQPTNVEFALNEAAAINYANRKCMEYTKQFTKVTHFGPLDLITEVSNKTEAHCHKNTINLISGGEETVLKEFPFMAALGAKSNENIIKWVCGGSLISERYVLTAAHCLTKDAVITVVRLGEYNLVRDDDKSEHKDYSVLSPTIHPNYHPPVTYNDIALIKLEEMVTFTDFIKPTCLWARPTDIVNITTAIGWGNTNYDSERSDVLLKVNLKVYDNSYCEERYTRDRSHFPDGILSSVVCAGDRESNKDTCTGDSGGPLLSTDKDNPCIQYIVGITSTGTLCGNTNSTAIYTRVSTYLEWIVNEIQK